MIKIEERFNPEIRKQLALLPDTGREHALAEKTQVRFLRLDTRRHDLPGLAGLFDRLCHARTAFAVESRHADQVARALDDASRHAGGFRRVALVLLWGQAGQAGLVR